MGEQLILWLKAWWNLPEDTIYAIKDWYLEYEGETNPAGYLDSGYLCFPDGTRVDLRGRKPIPATIPPLGDRPTFARWILYGFQNPGDVIKSSGVYSGTKGFLSEIWVFIKESLWWILLAIALYLIVKTMMRGKKNE